MSPASLAIIAFSWWGFVPIYWKWLQLFPSEELILYRILLSSVFLSPLLFFSKTRGQTKILAQNLSLGLFLSSLLIGFNWFLYVWAVNHNHIIEASLGYFLNPLLNMAFGTLYFREQLKPLQKIAGLFALLGTLVLVVHTGTFPWIALLLAISFALYGLVRKIIQVPTIPGTFLETCLLAPLALMGIFWLFRAGTAHTAYATSQELFLLSLGGIVTTVPLLAFAESAKYLAMSSLGFFQFLSPLIQFLLGVFLFKEPFSFLQWTAFGLIWVGLLIFLWDLRRPCKS